MLTSPVPCPQRGESEQANPEYKEEYTLEVDLHYIVHHCNLLHWTLPPFKLQCCIELNCYALPCNPVKRAFCCCNICPQETVPASPVASSGSSLDVSVQFIFHSRCSQWLWFKDGFCTLPFAGTLLSRQTTLTPQRGTFLWGTLALHSITACFFKLN